MGKIDIGTKEFLKISDVFAELFNVAVFQGTDYINPDDLEELDSVNGKAVELADGQLKFKEKFRDVKKLAKMGICFRIILGIEEQTEVHYYMPVRCMAYDADAYEHQCNEIRTRNIAQGKDFNPVSGVPKGTKIFPVLTLVFYVGADEWDGPRELYDMFDIPEDKEELVRRYIPNYPIYIFDAKHLSDEEIEQFRGDLRAFLCMICEEYDVAKLEGILANFQETWYAISAIKNDDRYYEEYCNYLKEEPEKVAADGGVRVDAVLDRIERRGVEIGEKRGMAIGEKRGMAIGEKRGMAIGEKRGVEIGENNGFVISAQVFKAVQAGMTDNNAIAKKCSCTVAQVQSVRKAFDI
ncbi:MAG: Rpn family recombination-promoting nuclease/putative transposase [Butyrivibrio sp.]|nr:Rpn family recombination-promoting nuclease/putative transposase [Butyrivibrio sp.]